MALDQKTQDYVNNGGTLINGQIPSTYAPTGYANTPTPPSSITSSTLDPQSGLPYVNPNRVPTYPVSSLNSTPQLSLTEPEKQQSDLNKQLQELNNSLVGESAYRSTQETAYGIPELQKTQSDLSSRLKGLQNEALAIPMQLQQDVTGMGVTRGGLQPIETAALRNNSIQALGVSSLLEASRGNLTYAQDLVDKAVAQKFDPIKEEIDAKTKNLQLIINSPGYSLADKNRAQTQLDIQNAQKAQLAKQEENYAAVQKIAVQTAANQQNFVPSSQYQTASQALSAIQNAPDAVTAQRIASEAFPAPVETKEPTTKLIGNDLYQYNSTNGTWTKVISGMSPTEVSNFEVDSTSQSILAQTGLSGNAFFWLTGRSSQLPRDQATRNAAAAEATSWANKNGVDISTLPAQYDAYNKVLAFNTTRQSMATVQENEIQGTIDNLQAVSPTGDLSKLNFSNVLKIWAGQQVNDSTAQQYAFHLEQLRNEVVAYNLIAQGQINSDGSLKQANKDDIDRATKVIKDGVAQGSLTGLSTAVTNSTDKMKPILQQSLDSARKAVWNLFGVGNNFKGTTGGNQSVTKSGKPFDYQAAINAGYTQTEIDAYLNAN